MTDLFLLMLQPGGGDELQGIKRGIVELADLVVVNKADGDLALAAGRSAADYRNALRFLQPRHPDWEVPVVSCSALEDRGVAEIWALVEKFRERMTANGELERARSAQAVAWLWDEIGEYLLDRVKSDPDVRRRAQELEARVAAGQTSPRAAAQAIIDTFWAT